MRVSVPATSANLGPGFDCLGLAISIKNQVIIRPCKMVAPILEELSEEYKDQIYIYKVNTEEQEELAAAFGIRSIPSILFCPMNAQPQMAQGALPKNTFKQAINEVLLGNA
jgi:thioredoxin-like negative regulator of GroEL